MANHYIIKANEFGFKMEDVEKTPDNCIIVYVRTNNGLYDVLKCLCPKSHRIRKSATLSKWVPDIGSSLELFHGLFKNKLFEIFRIEKYPEKFDIKLFEDNSGLKHYLKIVDIDWFEKNIEIK